MRLPVARKFYRCRSQTFVYEFLNHNARHFIFIPDSIQKTFLIFNNHTPHQIQHCTFMKISKFSRNKYVTILYNNKRIQSTVVNRNGHEYGMFCLLLYLFF